MSFWEAVIHLDQEAFLAVHQTLANPFFDFIMPWLRNPFTWIPIYVFLLYFSVKKFGKQGVLWCLAFILVFALCDFTAAKLIKPWVGRLRPCNDDFFIAQGLIRDLVYCGSGKSFPSAHSSNHFGLSFFIFITLGKYYRWIKFPAILWACLVVWAQIYVGVHYPLDILGGMILGAIMAYLVSLIFNKFVPLKPIQISK